MYFKIADFSNRVTSSTTLEKPFEANIYIPFHAGKLDIELSLFPE
tara:strand:- start:644 stop:778 length:135 start_codon:yes stop_codon:yes gene_type:complete